MRSPLIMRLPGVSVASGTMPEPVESVDIYPTLVDFCKLPMPAHLDGESLLPLMSGERSEPQYAYSQISPVDRKRHRYMAHTVRSKEYRYVEWRDSEDAFKLISRELYKLRGTYDETLNIVENPEYDSISQAHAEKLKSMFSHITD
jgi:arylsulfatase A-like enzyme